MTGPRRARLLDRTKRIAGASERGLVGNIEVTLLKADMGIAAEYLELSEDRDAAEELFTRIRDEFMRSRDAIVRITGGDLLADNPSLQRSILLRNPYIDPISHIQVMLLRRFREKKHSEKQQREILDVLRASVNGIAAGMRRTG